MENWNNYLTEQQFRDEFIQYLTENNITLTEEQLNEVNWNALAQKVKKAGGTAALLAALGVGGTSQAGGFDWGDLDNALADVPAMQADAPVAKTLLSPNASPKELKAHLELVGQELASAQGTDFRSRADAGQKQTTILINYGFENLQIDPDEPHVTTFTFKTSPETSQSFEINTNDVPAGWIPWLKDAKEVK
tara:strand:- start:48 stop:623 length:576 start_codon:yes stop_codon:yes gene_type:complete